MGDGECDVLRALLNCDWAYAGSARPGAGGEAYRRCWLSARVLGEASKSPSWNALPLGVGERERRSSWG